RHDVAPPAGSDRHACYEWFHAGRWNGLRLEFAGTPSVPADDSEAAFITEHYWGYARQRDGGTLEYQVEHPRWTVWRVTRATLDCDVAAFYGPDFGSFLCAPPSSAFVAGGSSVVVRRGVRL